MNTRLLVLVAVLSTLLATPKLWAAPEPMSRDAIIELAASGVDFSYYWGRGSWRSDGTQPGSCSGNCPNCTHSGRYGADCSGFVAKAWQVPGPSPVETNAHPYSTRSFRYGDTHWTHIDRGSIQRADALVYRNSANSGGHIVVYESGDPWGQAWAYEARGCNYGIVHNVRSFGSSYVAIERHNLATAPVTGVLKGVVFVDRGQGAADMSERVDGAQVRIGGGPTTTTTGTDAGWSFTLAPGSYGASVSAEGYSPASRNCAVTAGAETWCSLGVVPVCVPDCDARVCGLDPVCGSSCGSCGGEDSCNDAGQCEPPPCVPDCGSQTCGVDPVCGQSCGSCAGLEQCVDGQCQAPQIIAGRRNPQESTESAPQPTVRSTSASEVELGRGMGCRAFNSGAILWAALLPLLGFGRRRRRE